MTNRTVSLSPQHAHFVREMVQAGTDENASEVVIAKIGRRAVSSNSLVKTS
jgi:Arc/MetJ-type ribon-helix-helix transcriptional regulator